MKEVSVNDRPAVRSTARELAPTSSRTPTDSKTFPDCCTDCANTAACHHNAAILHAIITDQTVIFPLTISPLAPGVFQVGTGFTILHFRFKLGAQKRNSRRHFRCVTQSNLRRPSRQTPFSISNRKSDSISISNAASPCGMAGDAAAFAPFVSERERRVHFMRLAIAQAEAALTRLEVPVGCVIVHNNKVVAAGSNRTNETRNVSPVCSTAVPTTASAVVDPCCQYTPKDAAPARPSAEAHRACCSVRGAYWPARQWTSSGASTSKATPT
ncbi:unnamed protein product, partial [Closterium sp. Naga37s-1]